MTNNKPNANTPPDPSDTDIPPPYKMGPNAWELGYYNGYTGQWDQELWNHPIHSKEYQKGWREGSQFRALELLAEHNNPKDHP